MLSSFEHTVCEINEFDEEHFVKHINSFKCTSVTHGQGGGEDSNPPPRFFPNKWKAEKNGFLVFSKVFFTYTRRKNAANRTLR